MTNVCYTRMATPIGNLLLAADAGELVALRFEDDERAMHPPEAWREHEDAEPLREAKSQLQAYFARTRQVFELPLNPAGTPFQRAVWSALADIPYGRTLSYGQLARRLGNPKAVRAVGAANGKNPLPIILPCHRVIGSDGRLTGYGGGLHIKAYLLDLEQHSRQRALPWPH